MAGSMRAGKRPGTWELRVDLARDPITGKRRQVSRTVTGTERDADKTLAFLVAEVGGLDLAPGQRGGTMSDLAERWFNHLESRGRAASTIYGYRKKWAMIEPLLGAVPVAVVSPQRIDAAYSTLLADGVGVGTVAYIHATLRSMMSQARKWRMIDENPVSDAEPPQVPQREPAAPSTEVVRALIAVARKTNPWLAAYIRVSAALGTRRGETLAIRWCDVGVDAIDVSAAMIRVPGQLLVRKGTKTHAAGEIPVDAGTLAVLNKLRMLAAQRAAEVGVELPDDAYVFTDDPAGIRPWLPDRVSKLFERLRAGVPGGEQVTLKSLRAYTATVLVDGGADLRTAQARLRHRHGSTTQRHYVARRREAEVRAADSLGDALG